MTPPSWIRWPDGGMPRIAFGGDYNPEQWDEQVWLEDVSLMRQAGVNLVNLAVFGWSHLEPEPGLFEFGMYDTVMDLLHDNGIAVDLATGTASPPAWLVAAHPEMLPVTAGGEVLGFGARQSWCPSSPAYREHSLRLVQAMADHFGGHPALALWHVSNELGCHNERCYCPVSAAAFRSWLQARYGDLETLNFAWGTSFWSQRYTQWDQVQPPRKAPTFPNPTQQLDFDRFSSDALLEQLTAEHDVLAVATPTVPVTTNFMVMSTAKHMDYATWARHVDLVSNDHYLRENDPHAEVELAFSADLVRGIAGGRPWMLMEHSTSAVNWGQVNRAKRPGELRRNSMAQVARGADAISFFQWRASRAGAEKYHSAMLPHAGPDTRVHREVRELGADLAGLAQVVGSRVQAEVALIFDWPSWWASELDSHPSNDFRYREAALALYQAMWHRNTTVDVVPAGADLSKYRMVLVPALYLVDDRVADDIKAMVHGGASALITYFSGIVDENDHIRPGGYPGAFRDLLGIRVEEFDPLPAGQTVPLVEGGRARLWSEDVQLLGAVAIRSFAQGALAGKPAATCRRLDGGGSAWYLATSLEDGDLRSLLDQVCDAAGVDAGPASDQGVEVVRRRHDSGQEWLFAINHSATAAAVGVPGHDVLADQWRDGQWLLPPGDVCILRL